LNIKTLERRVDELEKISDPRTEVRIIFVSSPEEADAIESELDDYVLNVLLVSWKD